jgi:hypothetical protein
MSFPEYATGTVSIGAGATSVVGSSTIWTGVNARPGDLLLVADRLVLVTDVVDANHLTIPAWPGSAQAGVPYKLFQTSPLRFVGGQAMADVSALVAALNKSGFYHFVDADEDAPDPSLGDDGQYARKPTTGQEWLKTGGLWVSQGFSGNFAFSPNAWSAATSYGVRAVVPRAGKLWLSLQPDNLNHPPETSPAWWQVFMSGGDAYDVVIFDTDRPDSGEMVFKLVFTKAVSFYAGLADSRGAADAAATGTVYFSYRKNGVEFARLTFAAGSAVGIFSSAADANFALGDVLTVIAPAARDATLSGVGATLSGYRAG